ncbi:Rieske ISP assembly ATPase [Schizosaccharomyces octosporus yFS286]|uniref:Rieske ISP assembly ATPase n=1 Tax=Schizosaccharomyces octosporus (strain yFS286) TaxID=483514 RepID=S9PUR4_SCHOY|nr:Rieske ISP assembly ATPase [Schizosaccharomyces octosporus yFS286]EPX72871.1 Rieske ISP assembly ATPase [Schizosaccharomyces octosporus yFS286]
MNQLASSATNSPDTANGLQSILSGNSFFSAGIGLMGFGAGLAILRRGVVSGAGLIKRRMLVSVEIPSKEKSYNAFLHWMGTVPKRYSNQLAVEARGSAKSIFHPPTRSSNQPSPSSLFQLVPGPGKHFIKYKKCWIQVERQRSSRLQDLTTGTPWETITLTTLSRDRGIFSDMLLEAQKFMHTAQKNKTTIYTAWATDWKPFGSPRSKRLLSSVVLEKDVKNLITEDVRDFLGNYQWYADRGIPYRRGYLLYGPPGSGKTSFLYALAGELDYDICVLNLAERGLSDDRLNHLLSNVPPKSIVLLEDVDSAFQGRDRSGEIGFRANVTFSGLLNAVDGVTSADERIIFMTTNHPEILDPALIRPGRVDIKAYLGNATPQQVHDMFRRFYGRDDPILSSELSKIVCEKNTSMASLQGLFVMNKTSPEAALELAKELPQLPKSTPFAFNLQKKPLSV